MDSCSSTKGKIISEENGMFHIEIVSASACSGCHQKNSCAMIEQKLKVVEVPAREGYVVGDEVRLEVGVGTGMRAIVIGYFIPFVLLVGVLITVAEVYDNEVIAAMLAVMSIFLYYLVLFLFKNRIKKKFVINLI